MFVAAKPPRFSGKVAPGRPLVANAFTAFTTYSQPQKTVNPLFLPAGRPNKVMPNGPVGQQVSRPNQPDGATGGLAHFGQPGKLSPLSNLLFDCEDAEDLKRRDRAYILNKRMDSGCPSECGRLAA